MFTQEGKKRSLKFSSSSSAEVYWNWLFEEHPASRVYFCRKHQHRFGLQWRDPFPKRRKGRQLLEYRLKYWRH